MSEEGKKESGEVSRRQFLTGAGLVVGGAAIGAGIGYPLASGTEKEVPGPTVTVKTYVAPDGTEFATLGELITYLEGLPGGGGVAAIPGAVSLTINGESHVLKVEPEWTIAFVLKEKLGLTGAKIGCDRGTCGTCTIIVDGRTALACTMLAIEGEGRNIVTIEGLADGPNLHPVQNLFLENHTYQCGYCTPGMIMSAVALIDRIPNPTVDDAREAISGNLCYCSDYTRIVATIVKGV